MSFLSFGANPAGPWGCPLDHLLAIKMEKSADEHAGGTLTLFLPTEAVEIVEPEAEAFEELYSKLFELPQVPGFFPCSKGQTVRRLPYRDPLAEGGAQPGGRQTA